MAEIPNIEAVNQIFWQAIIDFHADTEKGGNDVFLHAHKIISKIELAVPKPQELRELLYEKAWVDTVQWHLEDEIRREDIEPSFALQIKRSIDKLNQYRTDLVEALEELYAVFFQDISVRKDARMNTETLGWALDRLAILALKIYHMQIEATRVNQEPELQNSCYNKWQLLLAQQQILSEAISALISDIQAGAVHFHTYKQMKMYNDPRLNPVLYGKNSMIKRQ